MKAPTLRRNGRRMVTMKVTYHLDVVDIGTILLAESEVWGPPASKAAADRMLRSSLRHDGAGLERTWDALPSFAEYDRPAYDAAVEAVEDRLAELGFTADDIASWRKEVPA